VADLQELRERVQEKAEEAVREEMGGSDGGDGDSGTQSESSGELLSTAEIAERGWDLNDYNSFFAECRESGYGASACGEMWSDAKDAGLAGGGDSVKPVDDDADGSEDHDHTHVLMMMEDSDSSDLAAKYLSSPIMDGEIEVVTVGSGPGQNMLESVDEVPAVPAHLIVDDSGVRVGDLEELIETYAV